MIKYADNVSKYRLVSTDDDLENLSIVLLILFMFCQSYSTVLRIYLAGPP